MKSQPISNTILILVTLLSVILVAFVDEGYFDGKRGTYEMPDGAYYYSQNDPYPPPEPTKVDPYPGPVQPTPTVKPTKDKDKDPTRTPEPVIVPTEDDGWRPTNAPTEAPETPNATSYP